MGGASLLYWSAEVDRQTSSQRWRRFNLSHFQLSWVHNAVSVYMSLGATRKKSPWFMTLDKDARIILRNWNSQYDSHLLKTVEAYTYSGLLWGEKGIYMCFLRVHSAAQTQAFRSAEAHRINVPRIMTSF